MPRTPRILATRQGRRLGALVTVTAIGLLLWARLIVISRMPRQAIAEPPAAVGTAPDVETSDAPRPSPRTVALDAQPLRDPFAVDDADFPRSTRSEESAPEASKSPTERDDLQQQSAVRREQELRALADRFRLDAVMTGSDIAVIGDTTYRRGDVLPAVGQEQIRFELVEVKARSAVLGFENLRFEIRIADPGLR